MHSRTKAVLTDLALGVLATILMGIVPVATTFQVALIAAAVLFLAVGFLCGRNESLSIWTHTLLSNALILLFSLFFALGNPPLLSLPLASLAGAFVGCYVRFHWKSASARKNVILVSITFAAVLLAGFLGLPKLMEIYLTETVNTPAPQFELSTLEGISISSKEFTGRIVVLDFWATWCGPCIAEFSKFQKIYTKYREDPRVMFVVVNTGWRGDSIERARAFVKARALDFPFAYDANARATELFQVRSIPSLILIDKKGNIRIRHTGYDESEDLVSNIAGHIEELLAEH